ncbi:unnamed protein product, partial [Mesorhabditis belari]|uniref:Uncharacterized protein n=1 Tax=Mesorhabditis belari TaxID=2138241 RepID=A0AAF3EN04_9BILA
MRSILVFCFAIFSIVFTITPQRRAIGFQNGDFNFESISQNQQIQQHFQQRAQFENLLMSRLLAIIEKYNAKNKKI